MAKVLAITNCRVSTKEQEQNGSLSRQQASVMTAAKSSELQFQKTDSGAEAFLAVLAKI